MRREAKAVTAGTAAWALMTAFMPGAQVMAVTFSPTHIWLNGQDITDPVHTAANDPSTNQPTTFMPIYYAMQVLNKLGIQSGWDGTHWSLTVPSSMTPNLDNPATSPNQMSIAINGKVVQTAPKLVAKDPASGQDTTFIPIWYLFQALNRLGIQSTWDGTNWNLTYSLKPATKMTTVKDFMTILGVAGDSSGTNPYDDVTSQDWPLIHAAVEKGYFTADSSTHFGATDSISASDVDHAYQLYLGIPDSHMSWNAGGNVANWSNIIGLNKGVDTSTNLSTVSEQQMMTNLTALKNGYTKDANGTYHLVFRPYDAYAQWANNPRVNQQFIVQGLVDAIKHIDSVSFTVNGSSMTFSVPGISVHSKEGMTTGSLFNHGGNLTQYSLDGGATWHQTTGFYGYDSLDPNNGGTPNPPAWVIVRTEGHAEVTVGAITTNNDAIDLIAVGITPGAYPVVQYGV